MHVTVSPPDEEFGQKGIGKRKKKEEEEEENKKIPNNEACEDVFYSLISYCWGWEDAHESPRTSLHQESILLSVQVLNIAVKQNET